MPYIKQADRLPYDLNIQGLAKQLKGKPKGHLTYVLYRLAKDFVPEQRYAALSDTRASIGDAYDEFYRRLMAPYEDQQIKTNGDV